MRDAWPKDIREAVWSKTQGRCWYCGVALVASPDSTYLDQFCMDHLVSWRDGGTHDLSNLVAACRRCNSRKGRRSLEWFRQLLARDGLPLFSQAHLDYLHEMGVDLPPGFPCYPDVTFFGETLGTSQPEKGGAA